MSTVPVIVIVIVIVISMVLILFPVNFLPVKSVTSVILDDNNKQVSQCFEKCQTYIQYSIPQYSPTNNIA